VRQFFPNEDPIGKKITLGWGRGPGTPRAGGEVVGIIGDVKDAGLNEADPPQLSMPYQQWPVQGMSVVLKTSIPPASVIDAARREVYAVDASIPISNLRTMEPIVSRSISQPRFYMTLLAVFANDTTPRDPVTFASVAGLLLFVALFASYVPARRATRVDPIVALRTE
jgi:hypothetical protein